ncbi:4-hydroxybenzoate octaprenyltransferase [Planctomycetes bacterium Pan216]|uniref:4-hydroxybenzoate polyprenyltransferase n=1 Tax=Kolteria novifilia TaxID=2527975 RepID=A0A518B179_9BACT|nr:4-hydroxybenzoate octaprenyltransferase [Planctomycetes bacterium Pan216]
MIEPLSHVEAPKSLWARLSTILEMIKFSHTIFALPFALLAAAIASHREGGWRVLDLVAILLCMVLARSAAMAFNRWADQRFDRENPRTATRAIPAGLLSSRDVLKFVVLCSLGFVAATTIFIASSGNIWPLVLSVPVLLFLLAYSYMKRFTSLAHVWLGTALALSPVAAWIAIRGTIEWPPVLLGVAIACWVTGFDIIYACQDIDVDRQQGLHSIPSKLGFQGAMNVARVVHVVMVVALVGFGVLTPELGIFFWIGLGIVAILLAVEHWLVRGRDLLKINLAFLQVNGTISTLLLLVTLADLYLPAV